MERNNRTNGVLPGETAESILAGIRTLSGQIALQDLKRDVEQRQISQQARSAGTEGPGWEDSVAVFFAGVAFFSSDRAAPDRATWTTGDSPKRQRRVPCELSEEDRDRQFMWDVLDGLGRLDPDYVKGLLSDPDTREVGMNLYDYAKYESREDALWDRYCGRGEEVVVPRPWLPCKWHCDSVFGEDAQARPPCEQVTVDPDKCMVSNWFLCDRPCIEDRDVVDAMAAEMAGARGDLIPLNRAFMSGYLLEAGLAVLRDSMDLVSLACCLYYGDDTDAEGPGSDDVCTCLENALQGTITVEWEPYDDGFRNKAGDGPAGPEAFEIGYRFEDDCTTPFAQQRSAWELSASPTPYEYTNEFECFVLAVARLIFHETLHGCAKNDKHNKEPGECDYVYMAGGRNRDTDPDKSGDTNIECLLQERYMGTPCGQRDPCYNTAALLC